MGNRLPKIVTPTGDHGQTQLGNGHRVDKDSPRVDALGTIEELSSWLGVLISTPGSDASREYLLAAQHDLFDLGGQLRVPGTALLSQRHVERIEKACQRLDASLPAEKESILPGGSQVSSFFFVSRCVCRRAERRFVSLSSIDPFDDNRFGLAYLNHLSDLLYIGARHANLVGATDVHWKRELSLS